MMRDRARDYKDVGLPGDLAGRPTSLDHSSRPRVSA